MVVNLYAYEVKIRLLYISYCSIVITTICYNYLQELVYLFTYYYCLVSFDFFIFTSYKDFFSLYIIVVLFVYINIFIIMLLFNTLLYSASTLNRLKFSFYLFIFGVGLTINHIVYRIIFVKLLPTVYGLLHSILVENLVLYRYISVEMNIITVIKVFFFFYVCVIFISLFSLFFIIKGFNNPYQGEVLRYNLTVINIFIILFLLPGDVMLHLIYLVSIYFFYESLYIVLIYVKNYYVLLKKK